MSAEGIYQGIRRSDHTRSCNENHIADIEQVVARIRKLKKMPFITLGNQTTYERCEKLLEEVLNKWNAE
jgi:hypothetical protein